MSRILAFIDQSHWAMHPAAYITMREIVKSWAGTPDSLPRLTPEARNAAISAAREDQPSRTYTAPSSIAVLSMFGIIAPRVGMIDMSSEGCPLDWWMSRYAKVMRDPEVAGTITNADTPGGSVYQVQEAADLIFSLRAQKPNVCVTTGMCASAGYWLGSQFAELVISPSAQVGSIGVLMCHEDVSKMADDMGVTVTYITSPRGGNKAEGNPFTPLSEETIEHYNAQSDTYYTEFLAALSRGRGPKPKVIDQNWGRGRMIGSRQALSLGMVDRINPLQVEIDKMALSLLKRRPSSMKAEHFAELREFEMGATARLEQWESVQATVMRADESEETAQVILTAAQTDKEEMVEMLGRQGADEALRLAKAKLALMEVM